MKNFFKILHEIMVLKTKKLRWNIFLIMVSFLSVTLVGCSKDDKDNPKSNLDLTGIWVCIESNQTDKYYEGFAGDALIFFDQTFKSDINGGTTAKKCFLVYGGANNTNELKNYTVSDWDDEYEGYILEGNKLTVFESDWDRWIGTISISGNIMTYSFKYQDWNWTSGTMTEEEPYDYVAKFQKIQ